MYGKVGCNVESLIRLEGDSLVGSPVSSIWKERTSDIFVGLLEGINVLENIVDFICELVDGVSVGSPEVLERSDVE